MNCKPGDLAIIIRDIEGYDGKNYPDVLFQARTAGRIVLLAKPDVDADQPAWLLETPFDTQVSSKVFVGIGEVYAVDDDDVRPIRDQPGADETLTWASKPEAVPA